MSEGSGIDANPLNFCFDTDLSKNRQGRKAVILAPADDRQMIEAWLATIRAESDHEVARRLGVTDRQVRRIKTGKVSDARLREHAKADPKYRKDDRRPCPLIPASVPGPTRGPCEPCPRWSSTTTWTAACAG